MARDEKLLQRARNNQRDVRFSDFITPVAAVGFSPFRQRGTSHRRFLHIQPLANGKAKDDQVAQVLDAVDTFGFFPEQEER